MNNFTEFFIWVESVLNMPGWPTVGGVGMGTGGAMPQYEYICTKRRDKQILNSNVIKF